MTFLLAVEARDVAAWLVWLGIFGGLSASDGVDILNSIDRRNVVSLFQEGFDLVFHLH